jgi:hypothetical protein
LGSSTISLEKAFDYVEAKGVYSPRAQVAGFGTGLAIMLGNDCMSDLIAERFNWKFNRKTAPAFYTNSYQQDYPQVGLADVDWLEDCDVVDINNTQVPPPLGNATVRKQLSRSGMQVGVGPGGVEGQQVCWMYNKDLSYGVWPGANVEFFPLVTAGTVQQNPIMSMIDKNGNLLIVKTIGITGSTAPFAAAAAAEGTTVADGSVVWVVVSPTGQGWRVLPLPGPTGPVYQFTVYYQTKAVLFANLQQMLDPIPDNYARIFLRALEFQCRGSSSNPADQKIFQEDYPKWLKSLESAKEQGDREQNAYGAFPESSPVEETYRYRRNPQDPSQPY